ncbi:MAG: hypothetical protein ABH824_05505 [Nanoarchaeota archaeon]
MRRGVALFVSIIFLLMTPFSLADFSIDLEQVYESANDFVITGSCDESNLVNFQLEKSGETIWIAQQNVVENKFTLSYEPTSGTYLLLGVCGKSSINRLFCVGTNCIVDTEKNVVDPATLPENSESSGSNMITGAVTESITGAVTVEEFKTFALKLWREDKLVVILIPSAILLLIIIMLILFSGKNKKKPAINMDQLHTYVREEYKGGMTNEAIRKNLQKAGWTDEEISVAMGQIETPTTPMPQKMFSSPKFVKPVVKKNKNKR